MARRILMYSGGLDSFILKYLYKFADDECLFVDVGTADCRKERQLVETYFPPMRIISLPLAQWELQNKIIPFRNHFLSLVAAQYASEIYFGFTAGDTTLDKDIVFQNQMSNVLTYFASGPVGKMPLSVNSPIRILMPYKEQTKTELVRAYLAAGGDEEALDYVSRSCYSGEHVSHCGECRSCLRRFVALKLNGIYRGTEFKKDPVYGLREFYLECVRKDRNIKELQEVAECLKLVGLS